MALEISRPVRHMVQKQTFKIDMEVRVLFNPQNKLLKKAEERMAYEGSVSMKIADKGFTITSMIEEGEDYSNMSNRLTKLAIIKLADSLYPAKTVHIAKPHQNNEDI